MPGTDTVGTQEEIGMLRGEKVGLRARYESDVLVLHAELYDDIANRTRSDPRPWRPVPPDVKTSPFRTTESGADVAIFSVVELENEELAGAAVLWGIDTHNRSAHLGLSLRPSFRGRGLGTDSVRVLCAYGFTVLGLHRLQLETLGDNMAMIRAATRAGFLREGTLRRSSWVTGEFIDELIFGLLSTDAAWAGE